MPLDEGYQVDTTDDEGIPVKSGHSKRTNAINRVVKDIPRNHQLIIVDMGEVNHATDNV